MERWCGCSAPPQPPFSGPQGPPRRDEIGTRFGKVAFTRPVGRAAGAKRDQPVDRALGLCSRFSLGTVSAVVQLCTLMAFATARRTFAQFHEWAPSTRATLRMVDALGAKARGFLDHAAAAEQDGEVFVIEVDGKGAPMIHPREYERRRRPRRARAANKRHGRRRRRREHPKPRRKKGDKSKNAKVAFVGVIYTLRKTKRGMGGMYLPAATRRRILPARVRRCRCRLSSSEPACEARSVVRGRQAGASLRAPETTRAPGVPHCAGDPIPVLHRATASTG